MCLIMQIDSEAYYEKHWRWRGGLLATDPILKDKIDRILGMIPRETETILDVGCGDGTITNALCHKYNVTAVDRSGEALRHLEPSVARIRADAEDLPFTENGFDLVFSSEMIEHVPTKALPDVISEFRRIARRHVLLSVPNNEKLRKRFTLCTRCGHEFHIYSHFHSFSIRALEDMFSGWTVRKVQRCGVPDTPSLDWISILRNRLSHAYFYVDGMGQSCPN